MSSRVEPDFLIVNNRTAPKRHVRSRSSSVTVLWVIVVILAAGVKPSCGGESTVRSEGAPSQSSPSAPLRRSRGGLRRRLSSATAASTPSAVRSVDTTPPPPTTTPTTSLAPTEEPQPPSEWTGALVTRDCVYEGYGYAVDIYWSCGSEKFNRDLRLHTFKRHSRGHGKVFADQLITMRNGGQLWFDGYDESRCIYARPSGALRLTTNPSSCGTFVLLPAGETGVGDDDASYLLWDDETETCAMIGGSCGSRKDTGGRECGGIRHMYLTLALGPCDDNAASFRIATDADTCDSERPGSECFAP